MAEDKDELKRLRTIEARFSADIRWAYKKHFPDQPHLRLSLRNFFDLLIAKGKALGAKEAAYTFAHKDTAKRLNQALVTVLAPRRKEIQEALAIPVLVRPDQKRNIMKYSAVALRGAIKKAKGATAEEAYEQLKSYLGGVINTKSESLIHLRTDLMQEYEAASPLAEDEVEGFIVRARVQEL